MKLLDRYKISYLLGLLLLFAPLLAPAIAYAACGPDNLSAACSAQYGLSGHLSGLSGSPNAGNGATSTVTRAQMPTAGALLYVDYVALEQQARDLLARNMHFREDISPYRGANNFNELVRNFDVHSGFLAQYDDPNAAIGPMTLQQRIDLADGELRQARDLYAYLAVYAPVARFRSDTSYATPDLCARAEDPNPVDPNHSGQVLDPVIDWCNFAARMRQSVREAAYLRMIFAQQFMVDALGLHFSASALLGGEKFVREEVAKLQAAHYQFSLAEQGLTEPLKHALGSGCLVSDFYTQAEWALLSQAEAGKQQAQYQIGVRLSYLDINKVEDVPQAQARAQTAFRTASTAGYLNLIGTAGRAAAAPTNSGCTKGQRPDGKLVAEMVATMLDTSAKAHDLRAGRNIFGFDVTLTPARPYHTAFGSTDKGLWEQAKDAADLAAQIQQQTENAERIFDLNQQDLVKAVLAINGKVDYDIQKEAGCDLQGFKSDADYYACVQRMIEETAKCDPTKETFDACMARTTDGQPQKIDCSNCVILVSDMRRARQDLRVAYLGVRAAQTKLANIQLRKSYEELRNEKINSVILSGAKDVALVEGLSAALNCCSVTFGSEGASFTVNPGAAFDAFARPGLILAQAANDVKVANANSLAVVQNLILDIAEAQNEIDTAVQEYNAMLTTYNGVVGQTGHDVTESQRQHAYTVALPANDPSCRMVRDTRRLELAQQLSLAARLSYLAARRAEYEYTARLSGSNFRISDIYKARTANDILLFLQNLDNTVTNLPGSSKDAETNQTDLKLSVAQHLLGLTDGYLQGLGVAADAIPAERTRRFRQWVAENTKTSSDGKLVLAFDFNTSPESKAVIGQLVQQGYDFYWLHKVGGIGQPKPSNQGLGLNLVTSQTGNLGFRQVRVSQAGQVALRSFAGCRFDYRLIPPAVMLGLDFPNQQSSDVVSGAFSGDINGAHGNGVAGFSTGAFLGRPLASNGWQVVIYAASPDGILPDLDLQQLNDIELKISTTYATRPNNTQPQPAQCVRIDF